MRLSKKGIVTSTALVTTLIAAATFTPAAFAETTVEIGDTGSRSDNRIDLDFSKVVRIFQNNDADINNNISVNANTGLNSVEGNSGDVSITTGDVRTQIEIHNEANSNQIRLDNCGDCEQDFNFVIHDTGSRSDNEIDVNKTEDITVRQDNNADIDNNVNVHANTGLNQTESNNDDSDHEYKHMDHEDYDKDYDHSDYDKNHNYGDDEWDYGKWESKDYDHSDHDYDYDRNKYNYEDKEDDKNHYGRHGDWWKNMNNNWWMNWWKNMNDHYDEDENSGNTEITTGDVVTDLFIHNMVNKNYLSL